ncbi:MAG: pilin [Patescibacteria group bacterium]
MLVKKIIRIQAELILVGLFAVLFFLPVSQVAAQGTGEWLPEQCICYCYSPAGAKVVESPSTRDHCLSRCEQEENHLYLGCYTVAQADLIPENNSMCWTKAECEADEVMVYTGTGKPVPKKSVWAGMNPKCTIQGQTEKGNCYNPPEPITLSVTIGALKQAGTIGEYISAVYRYLIYVAALLAVIMIMIGGVQYAMARGQAGAIQGAKKTMGNAVVGLLLVLSAYLIASLIDPSLVTFKQIGVPKVRTVILIPDDATCEYLDELGMDIEKLGGVDCGDKGKVTSTERYRATTGNEPTITIGHECVYTKCPNVAEACVSSAQAEGGYDCMRCSDSYDYTTGSSNPKGLTPTEGNCRRMVPKNVSHSSGESTQGKYGYCEYDPGFTVPLLGDYLASCVELVYPETLEASHLDCDRLRSDAKASSVGSESCRAYDLVQMRWGTRSHISGYRFNEVDDVSTELLAKVCSIDPCGLGTAAGGCKVLDFEALQESVFGSPCDKAPFPASYFCSYVVSATSPVGCYDMKYANAVEGRYQAMSTAWSQLYNDWDYDKATTTLSNMPAIVGCTDAGGNESLFNCAPTW